MTLTNIKKMKDEKGFTIVELLIVIVVIGILAAIVIVAYNGIQNKARDTNNKTDAVSLVKVAEAVNADLGAYPTGATSAALTTSFNASSTSKIPTGVNIIYVTAAPTNAQAITDADTSRSYSVDPCTSAGLKVYYPVRGGSIQTATAGDTSAGC